MTPSGPAVGRRRLLRAATAAMLLPAFTHQTSFASASGWKPVRPIDLWISYPPGGGADTIARMVSQQLAHLEQWTLTPLNRPGAGGSLMLKALMSAKPDGQTVGLCLSSQMTFTPMELGQPPFASDAFSWIVGLARSPFALVARTEGSLRTLNDVARLARERPVTLGTTASMTWVAQRMSQALNREIIAVPFKGGAEMVQQTLAGHIDLSITAGGHLALEKAGKVVVVASLLHDRLPSSPAAGTMKEQGVDVEVEARFALLGPPGMAPEITSAYGSAFENLFRRSDIASRIESGLGLIPAYEPADAIRRSVEKEADAARRQLGAVPNQSSR